MKTLKMGLLLASLCLAFVISTPSADAGKSCVEKCESSCMARSKRAYSICVVSRRSRCAVIKRSFAKIKRLKRRSSASKKKAARTTASRYVTCRVKNIGGCIKGQAAVYKKCMLACVNTCIK